MTSTLTITPCNPGSNKAGIMTPNLDTVLLEGWFTSATLALPRLLTIFATVPFFSGQMVTGGVRAGLVAILVIFISPVVGDVQTLSLGLWVLIAAKEALIGLMLGLGFGVFVWALQSVGDFIDFQTGSGNAAFFDPVAGHENGPTGQFLGWLAITLFISAGGLLAMLGVIVDSYRLWPVTSFFPEPGGLLARATRCSPGSSSSRRRCCLCCCWWNWALAWWAAPRRS
jgi:type III secretion protein T